MRGEMENLETYRTVSQEDQFRATYYFMLSKLLSQPPTADTLAGIATFGVTPGTADSPFLKSLNALANACAGDCDLESLDDEYHDLFVGLGRGEVVPYSSWYIAGLMMDKPLSSVRQDLKALGIEREDYHREPEDHAAALFDVMGILIEAGDQFQFKAQQTFFGRHLKPWIRKFFKDLGAAKKADFYREVGEFGVEFIDFETEYLEMPV